MGSALPRDECLGKHQPFLQQKNEASRSLWISLGVGVSPPLIPPEAKEATMLDRSSQDPCGEEAQRGEVTCPRAHSTRCRGRRWTRSPWSTAGGGEVVLPGASGRSPWHSSRLEGDG